MQLTENVTITSKFAITEYMIVVLLRHFDLYCYNGISLLQIQMFLSGFYHNWLFYVYILYIVHKQWWTSKLWTLIFDLSYYWEKNHKSCAYWRFWYCLWEKCYYWKNWKFVIKKAVTIGPKEVHNLVIQTQLGP